VRGGPVIAYDPAAYIPSGGPLKLAYWNYYAPIATYVRAGLEKLGFKENRGMNTGSILGFAQWPATIDPDVAVRDSSETSFGAEAIERSTLQIYPNTLAKKILFNEKTATGVTVVTSGAAYNLLARKEVILAAGSVSLRPILNIFVIGSNLLIVSIATTAHGFRYWMSKLAPIVRYSSGCRATGTRKEPMGKYPSSLPPNIMRPARHKKCYEASACRPEQF
jgi:hypothetical protein